MIVWVFALSMFIARSYAQVGNVAHVPLAKVFLSWASGPVSTKLGIEIPWVKDGPFLKGDDHFLVKCWFHFLHQRTRVMKVLFKLVTIIICCPDEKCYYVHFLLLNDYCFLRWRYVLILILFVWILNRSVTDAYDWWIPPYDDIPYHQVRDSKLVLVLFHSFNNLIFCSINVIDS